MTFHLSGHVSFVADVQFSSSPGCLLSSLGWDSQLLFWKHITRQALSCPPPSRPRSKGPRGERGEVELMDMVGGYKLGPSLTVEFLPLMLRPLMGCGLLVAVGSRLGGTTLACYSKWRLEQEHFASPESSKQRTS